MITKEAVELYRVIKDLKLSGINTSERMKLILLCRDLRTIGEKFYKDLEEAKNQLKPEGYDEFVQRILEHNEIIASGKEGIINPIQLAEFKRKDSEFKESMDAFLKKINSEEVEVTLPTIEEVDFNKILDNNSLTCEQMGIIYQLV